MAKSKYEYVKNFERDDSLLPSTYIVVRIDGRGFHGLSEKYGFERPNDLRALNLMNAAATAVLKELNDITIAYGISDEYSFVFERGCKLFSRRESKIVTTVVSTFTAHYIYQWSIFFPEMPLSLPLPSFDGRAILYPSEKALRDYISWRQVDCHINNLYNTTFWTLVQKGGQSRTEADDTLKGTVSGDKNEILFSRFQINYDALPQMFRKGSVLYREHGDAVGSTTDAEREPFQSGSSEGPTLKQAADTGTRPKKKWVIAEAHVDIINDRFWDERPWLLLGRLR